ncbi:MAG: hypothetical protein HYX38_33020 [Rhodospirillales bacterium]|nr:hypothetical protein [Rhodospirillales bacterium]
MKAEFRSAQTSDGDHFVIQTIEGFVVAPLIRKPAWTLFAIVILGATFGTMGSPPLVAVGRLALMRFYVEDRLGDRTW